MPKIGFKHSEKTKRKISQSKIGSISPNKGKAMSEQQKLKIRQSKLGKGGPGTGNWKGDDVKYRGLHHWVENILGKANHCEECGLNKIPKGKKRYFQWANISHQYRRDIADWKQMCVRCHKKFDKK